MTKVGKGRQGVDETCETIVTGETSGIKGTIDDQGWGR